MTERYQGEESQRIALWFVPTRTPEGAAPVEIRDQWVSVPLPVRQRNVVNEEDTIGGYKVGADIFDPTSVRVRDVLEVVVVDAWDAITALRAGERIEAADWWEHYMGGKHWMFGNNLMFRSSEGRLLSPKDLEQEYPEMLERFEKQYEDDEDDESEPYDDIPF